MTDLKLVKPTTEAERTTRTTTDTWEVSPNDIKSWKAPPFQREKRVNDKVRALANVIRDNDGVIPGTLIIGVLEKQRYLIDGQHRCEAFLLSECLVGYCDVRILHFDTMAEMAKEFVHANSRLVALKPDDILRAMESSYPPLAKIRRKCPFVGYGMIRRGEKSPILSMSAAIRCWTAAIPESPKSGGRPVGDLAEEFSADEADHLIDFLEQAMAAWGKDPEYSRLWLGLNLTICMWLYRRLVITPYSAKTQRITKEQFGELMMGLSADPKYLVWLVGRQLRETDRSPCYMRVKKVFADRLETKTGKRALLPAPDWASSVRGAGGGIT